jgi:SAM-dependent methyltransferase
MDYTGERMVPEEADPNTFWEHIFRYAFAIQFCFGKRVLDVACGEGYGTAALIQAGAMTVTGVDISTEACGHSARKYRIETSVGDAENLPFKSASFDLLVSFETIEHLERPDQFMAECSRVLAPGGRAIISTPNKAIYNEIDPSNPFHIHELEREEFLRFCRTQFADVQVFSQKPLWAPWWSIRGLAAVSWQATRIRGVNRIRSYLAQFESVFCDAQLTEARKNPVKSISESRNNHRLTNPYALRKERSIELDKPVYLIAVCEKG